MAPTSPSVTMVSLQRRFGQRSSSRSPSGCVSFKSTEHYLSQFPGIVQHSLEEVKKWITDGKRCCNCGRNHEQQACTLKKP
ncbi:hypothetical protein ABVT39_022197 [Epinephelus coioides]